MFEANLFYGESSKTGRATQRNLVSIPPPTHTPQKKGKEKRKEKESKR